MCSSEVSPGIYKPLYAVAFLNSSLSAVSLVLFNTVRSPFSVLYPGSRGFTYPNLTYFHDYAGPSGGRSRGKMINSPPLQWYFKFWSSWICPLPLLFRVLKYLPQVFCTQFYSCIQWERQGMCAYSTLGNISTDLYHLLWQWRWGLAKSHGITSATLY